MVRSVLDLRVRCATASATLLLLGSCGSGGDDTVRSGARDERPAPTAAPAPLSVEDIAARRAAWERSAPQAYRYVITSTCGCDRDGSFTVTVEDGEVAVVEKDGAPVGERFRLWPVQTVDGMFDMFDEAVGIIAGENVEAGAEAAFDAERGHPTSFAVRWTAGDEPYEAVVTDFEELDPADVEAAPDTVPLSMTNQSYEHPDVHLTVLVDGDPVVDTVVPVLGQHHVVGYGLPLAPGRHELVVTSDSGARSTEAFEVIVGGPTYIRVAHWGGADPGEAPASLEVEVDDEPFLIA